MRLLIASLVAFVVPAAANGTLSGGVRTSSNAPVPYTRVTWGAVTTGGCINNPGHAWTASNGTWGSPSLSNGTYSVGCGSAPCVNNVYLCSSGNGRTINNNNVTGVNFVKVLYSITTSSTTGGSMKFTYGNDSDSPTIDASSTMPAACGTDIHVAINPDASHDIIDVLVDDVSVGAVASYTFPGVMQNHKITANFVPNSYIISASAGPNGTISPSGSVNVQRGTSRTFIITPNACYHIQSLVVDGANVSIQGSYTFPNVVSNHSISATFAIDTYTISASAGPNGTIFPSGSVGANCGTSPSFTISPNSCYRVASVVVDGVSQSGPPSGYTFQNVHADHTISATFILNSGNLPPAPAGLQVTNLGTANSLQISWSPVSGATAYTVHRTWPGGSTDIDLSATGFVDGSLTRNVTYTYAVAARSACGTGPYSGGKSKAPDYYPTLLVHGVCASAADFTECSLSGLGELKCSVQNPVRLGDCLKSAGMSRLYAISYPNNAALASVAPTLKQRIKDILAATGETRLNIVAHSQGGLISRYALQYLGMSPSVARLVMIATPNHGSELAKGMLLAPAAQWPVLRDAIKKNSFLQCLSSGQATYDLVTGSAFLNQLNYGTDKSKYDPLLNQFNPFQWCATHKPEVMPSGTDSWLILGTGGWCGSGSAIPDLAGLCVPHDGVVSIANGRLTSLDAFHSRRDDRLDPSHLHPRATHSSACMKTGCNLVELDHPTLISAAYLILTNGTLPGSPEPLDYPQDDDSLAAAAPWAQLFDGEGMVAPGDVHRDTVSVGPNHALRVTQVGDVGGLGLSLVDPNGVRFTPADTLGGLVSYDGSSEEGIQTLTITPGVAGRWTLETAGARVTQQYSIGATAQVDTALGVQIFAPVVDSLVVRAALFDAVGSLPGSSIQGTAFGPDGLPIGLEFFDDGAHGDSLSGDGIAGAIIPRPGLSGEFGARVTASMTGGPDVPTQETFTSIALAPLTDLALDPLGVSIEHSASDPDSYLVSVGMQNLGPVDIEGALVQFEDSEGNPIATVPADCLGGSEVRVTAGWRPVSQGPESFTAFIDRDSPFLQQRYDNDSLQFTVDPSTVGVDPPFGTRLALAPPRPNPARSETRIDFELPAAGHARIDVYDVAGRRVATILDADRPAGPSSLVWDGRTTGGSIRSGVYFYELRASGRRLTRRVVFLR